MDETHFHIIIILIEWSKLGHRFNLYFGYDQKRKVIDYKRKSLGDRCLTLYGWIKTKLIRSSLIRHFDTDKGTV